MTKYYKYQYRFNARHSFDDNIENAHAHTFTTTLYVSNIKEDEQILFYNVDNIVEDFLGQYAYKFLNRVPLFDGLNPTVENIGDVFFDQLEIKLEEVGVSLHQLDIYENPLSIYQVSSRNHLPRCYNDKRGA